jgi:hypothetical protein
LRELDFGGASPEFMHRASRKDTELDLSPQPV